MGQNMAYNRKFKEGNMRLIIYIFIAFSTAISISFDAPITSLSSSQKKAIKNVEIIETAPEITQDTPRYFHPAAELVLKDDENWVVKKPAVLTPASKAKPESKVNPGDLTPTKR